MLPVKPTHLLLSVALGAMLAPAGMAQMKIAFVDTQKAILDTAEIAKEQAAMEARFKPQQDELAKMTQDLQDVQNKLQSMAGQLTPEAQADLQMKGQRLQRDIQRKTEDLNAEGENYRTDVLQRVGERMRAILQKMAEEKGLDALFDSSAAVYIKPVNDVTAEATAAYNAAHPAQ